MRMAKISRHYFNYFLLLIWLILLSFGMSHHVFWRDEVRALNIAKAAETLWNLPTYLTNEGHPILWYALLKLSFSIFKSNLVLPILAAVFATLNVLILLFKSPFHWSFVALFIFGQYGLFEYGIIARNYGIAVTLFFTFAMLYRQKKDLGALLVLALAAQTNFYATIFSLLLGAFVMLDRKDAFKNYRYYMGFGVLLLSGLISYLLCTPSAESLVVQSFSIQQVPFSKIWDVGWGFDHLFDGIWGFKHGFKTFLLFAILTLFWKNKKTLIIAFLGMVFMAGFHLSIRPNYSHHEGMFLLYIIALFWANQSSSIQQPKKLNLQKVQVAGYMVMLLILTFNLVRGIRNYELYVNLDQSNADHLGLWLKSNTPANAVYIAEPDYDIEGVMYYQNQPFYLPRESQFGTYAQFTTANESHLSLSQLLTLSDSFQRLGKVPYLIVQFDLENTVDTLLHSYDKHFEIDSQSYQEFNRKFEKVADFHEFISTDESFYVYTKKKK